MTLEHLLPFSGAIIAGFAAGIAGASAWRLKRTLDMVLEQTRVAFDQLDMLERARDPGREVHDRLAFALESGMIATSGPRVEPAVRRATAQLLAAQVIEDIRRANLELSTP